MDETIVGDRLMENLARCFVMICTKQTERECLARGLFGDREDRLAQMAQIERGDPGLLFNVASDELLGLFWALGRAERNIEPAAWQGEFPAQIRVENRTPIKRVRGGVLTLASAGVQLSPIASGRLIPASPIQSADTANRLLEPFSDDLQSKPDP